MCWQEWWKNRIGSGSPRSGKYKGRLSARFGKNFLPVSLMRESEFDGRVVRHQKAQTANWLILSRSRYLTGQWDTSLLTRLKAESISFTSYTLETGRYWSAHWISHWPNESLLHWFFPFLSAYKGLWGRQWSKDLGVAKLIWYILKKIVRRTDP